MKKVKFIFNMLLCAFLLYAMTFTASALSPGDKVNAELPRFDITFNGEKIDTTTARYPVVVYNDITYIPVSDKHTTGFNYLQYLGVDCGEKRSYHAYHKLFLRNMFFERDFPDKVEFTPFSGERNVITATVSENRNIITNKFGDVKEYVTDEYPMLTIDNVDYIPMTYKLAHEYLGLWYSFSTDTGLSLSRANIPERIVSVPSFDVTLNGVKYQNDKAKYPFLYYNGITYMPLTKGICDFMGLNFVHKDAAGTYFEALAVSNKHARSDVPEFDYIKEGDVFSFALYEPFDGELYINGESTKWHTFGMEYPPLRLENVYYLPLTWQIAALHFDWEYSFDIQNGLVLDSRNAFRPEFSLDFFKPVYAGYSPMHYCMNGDYYVVYSKYTYDIFFESKILKVGKRGIEERTIDISDLVKKYNIEMLHINTGAVPKPRIEGNEFIAYWAGIKFVFNLDTCTLTGVFEEDF